MSTFISGIFPDRVSAERAVDALQDIGYDRSDINVILHASTKDREFAAQASDVEDDVRDTNVAANLGIGAAFGGTLGAIIAGVTATGAIVGTGGLAAPIVAGPIAAMLAGAGAGGLAGGLIGALTGAGLPEDRAAEYEEELGRGSIVVGVYARHGDEQKVSRILNAGSGYSPDSFLSREDQNAVPVSVQSRGAI